MSLDESCVFLSGPADVQQVRQDVDVRSLLESEDIASQIPASEEIIEQFKLAECLPQHRRAVLGRLNLSRLTMGQLMRSV